MPTPRPIEPLALAERLFALLDQGKKSATYKLAVLVALMDHCLERTAMKGTEPGSITTRELAERVVGLYWNHAESFQPARGAARVLRQGTSSSHGGTGASILDAVVAFRAEHPTERTQTPTRARLAHPVAWQRLVDDVERTLILMPIPKLQRVGRVEQRFLYDYAWNDSDDRPSESQLRKYQRTRLGFDNNLKFLPGVAEGLVRLNTLLRPALQRAWLRLVIDFNAGAVEEAALDEHLFGHARTNLAELAGPLSELQSGRCFYCDSRIAKGPHVDHFVPWARHPNDGLENLVVAHAGCNTSKSDFLAAAAYVERWSERLRTNAGDLVTIAETQETSFEPARASGVALALYTRLPDESLLWAGGEAFEPVGGVRERVRTALLRAA